MPQISRRIIVWHSGFLFCYLWVSSAVNGSFCTLLYNCYWTGLSVKEQIPANNPNQQTNKQNIDVNNSCTSFFIFILLCIDRIFPLFDSKAPYQWHLDLNSYGAHILLGTVILLYRCSYSSLCTLVHRQTCGWLTLGKPAGDLRASLFLTNESPSRITRLNQADQSQI